MIDCDGSEEVVVAAAHVAVGDTVVVRPGQRAPVDGVLQRSARDSSTAGHNSIVVDERLLTGELGTVVKAAGDTVYSGSTVVSGVALMRARRVAADSSLALMRRELTLALEQQRPSAMEEMATSASRLFTPFALALAAVAHVVAGRRGGRSRSGTSTSTAVCCPPFDPLVLAQLLPQSHVHV